MKLKEHWERVYSTKATDAVSWYQKHAEQSLRWIRSSGLPKTAAIVDVGGGASTLVDDLLHEGYSALTVLDLSAGALAATRARLGEQDQAVTWIEADITEVDLPSRSFDLWHDCAVFHFLTTEQERAAYVRVLLRALKPGGHLIVATFAEDGPSQCSGLPVTRYTPSILHAEFGSAFTLFRHEREEHHTPSGTVQRFVYCYFRRATS
jgi:ubiquinone/menaquinone biosynthesis C-methylase UbiE